MTPEQEQKELLRRRKAQREEKRQQARKQKKKMQLQLLAVGLFLLLAAGTVAVFTMRQSGAAPTEPSVAQPVQPTADSAPETGLRVPQTGGTAETGGTLATGPLTVETVPPTTEADSPRETEREEYTVIHIAAAGDLNVTAEVVEHAKTDAGYDFEPAFQEVAPLLSGADLTLLNLEGTMAGEPYGDDRSSAPVELAQTLKSMGVDVVQTANSASVRAGILGLQDTIKNLYGAGLVPVGTFYDSRSFRDSGGYTIVEVDGMRIALVAFTKGMDNLGLPQGSEDCVNLLYEDYTTTYKDIDRAGIRKVLRNVQEEQPDLTIAMLHWGSEYNEDISKSQKSIRSLMLEEGVDLILGTHSHLVQTVEYDEEAGTLVAYSLGDFFGDADQPGSNYSIVLDVEVTRDNLTGEVRISGYSYTPIFTVRPEDSDMGGHRVVQLEDAIRRYETGFIGKVTPDIYSSMTHALTRVDQRVNRELE